MDSATIAMEARSKIDPAMAKIQTYCGMEHDMTMILPGWWPAELIDLVLSCWYSIARHKVVMMLCKRCCAKYDLKYMLDESMRLYPLAKCDLSGNLLPCEKVRLRFPCSLSWKTPYIAASLCHYSIFGTDDNIIVIKTAMGRMTFSFELPFIFGDANHRFVWVISDEQVAANDTHQRRKSFIARGTKLFQDAILHLFPDTDRAHLPSDEDVIMAKRLGFARPWRE